MPTRSPSYSPEARHHKKKEKKSHRSEGKKDKRDKHRSPSEEDHHSRHKHHKKHKRNHSPSESYEENRHKVKKEKIDRGYDKYDTAVPSKWEGRVKYESDSDSDHRHRSVKQEYDSDSDRHRHRVKREPDSDGEHHHHNHHHRRHRGDDRRQEDLNERRHHDDRRREKRRQRGSGNPFAAQSEDNMEYGRRENTNDNNEPVPEKEKPNLEVSGKLAEDTNTYKGVVIKYNEPGEARKPKKRWRLYPFKGDEALPVLHIHRQSAYLLGRDRRVADIPIDHPSCSKQHAVLQFRLMPFTRDDGTEGRRIRPYVIDLASANGTYLNGKRIEGQRYHELMEKDVVKFGFSSREYVVLTDKADTSEVAEEGE